MCALALSTEQLIDGGIGSPAAIGPVQHYETVVLVVGNVS